jgi:hypothetical protein
MDGAEKMDVKKCRNSPPYRTPLPQRALPFAASKGVIERLQETTPKAYTISSKKTAFVILIMFWFYDRKGKRKYSF